MRAGTRTTPKPAWAFTLIELLVVITILLILMAGAASLTQGTLSASELSSTANQVTSIFARAREVATVDNQMVQVRIYDRAGRYEEIAVGVVEAPDDPTDADYNIPANFEFRKLENHYVLPATSAILLGSYSTVIGGVGTLSSNDYNVITGTEMVNGTSLPYSAITFTPDRRILLADSEVWTLTLVKTTDSLVSSTLPANYASIVLNPRSARATIIRP